MMIDFLDLNFETPRRRLEQLRRARLAYAVSAVFALVCTAVSFQALGAGSQLWWAILTIAAVLAWIRNLVALLRLRALVRRARAGGRRP